MNNTLIDTAVNETCQQKLCYIPLNKQEIFIGKHTGQLKDDVTSPGGTTIRAVQMMERAGIRGVIMDAVQASCDRANELGKN